MRTHLQVIGVLNIILGILNVIGGGIVLLTFLAPGIVVLPALPLLGAFGLFVSLFLIVPGIFGIAAGQGLMNLAPWARVAMIVLSIIHLINMTTFGFSTILGIYTLIILFMPETEKMFQRGY